jgi:hypothetical protein
MNSHSCYLVVAVTALAGGAAACDSGLIGDRWPTFTVMGRVTSAAGAPVVGTEVRVTTWTSPATCSDPVASTLGAATTDRAGTYQTVLFFLTSTFSGCIRVQAGTAQRDTLVNAVPPNGRIAVDLEVP